MFLVKQRLQFVYLVLSGLIFLIGVLSEYLDDYEVYSVVLLLAVPRFTKVLHIQPIFSVIRNKSCYEK